eukprot:TRINITY_DN12064_c0_g1_i1.p2 TRINITY_DN12064_c0_g1~~TRINITY_DN12064_c0_g1_i1.p2  ORF type:complete len:256 (+),score=89.44 TRINITY_DN12064_c0_g1_i1:23-769(+)
MSAPVADANQLAGHAGNILKLEGGRIMKLVKDPEANFYKGLAARNLDPVALEFIPKFFGVQETDGKQYIIIEDLTVGMEKLSMMDLKMGTSSADPLLSQEKREAMAAKDKVTTTVSLGLRICGVRICDLKNDTVFKEGKPWGKKIKDHEMLPALKQFLSNGNGLRKDVAQFFLERAKRLLTWQEKQTDFKVYSSSIFFAYDAAASGVVAHFKMIDFAHVIDITDGKSHDEEYLVGLRNLIKFLEEIVA